MFLNPYLSAESMLEFYSSKESMGAASERLSRYYKDFEGSQTERFYKKCFGLLGEMKRGGELLDVGCGRGNFLSLAKRFGWNVSGLEPGREHAAYASEELGIEIANASLETAHFDEGRFDVITLWDVIEHVGDPRETLSRVSSWLKEEGLLLLATPNHQSLLNFLAQGIYYLTGGLVKGPLTYFFVPEHVLYFTSSTLRRLVRGTGFEPVREIKTGTDIDRYTVSLPVKVTAKILLWAARLLRQENRILMICRKKSR